MLNITEEQIQNARKVLGHLKTPLVYLCDTKTAQGNSIFLKAENLHCSGSFKLRGATYALSQLSKEQKEKGVIAYSTGNHAQAVALAARNLGIKATIVMSSVAPQFKIDATKSYGAHVIMTEPFDMKDMAKKLAEEHGYFFMPPFDHPYAIIGQATIGLEIIEECVPAAVFVAIGGGGLISGIALAIKKKYPSVKIIGVEPELEDDVYRSFKAKKRISMEKPSNSIADAIKISIVGELTFPIILKYVDDIVTVNEKQIAEATVMHAEKAHLVVEPAGALPLAAALSYKSPLDATKPVVCIASGGNTTVSFLQHLKSQYGI
ncbi:MAG TPA: threonine/serine dehydratase [Chlamydiales bacterium]|nr:threonine/serine dehydratase [Chlamydiales bacterium]